MPPTPGVADVAPRDVLFGKLRPYLAKTWVADRPVRASTELLCMHPLPGIDSRWLGYLVASTPFVDWAVATSDGAKMPRTSWERIGEYRMAVPLEPSQRAIADYLDRETVRIDALTLAKQHMLELLQERWQDVLESTIRELGGRYGLLPLKYVCRKILVGIVVTPAAWYAETGIPALRGSNISAGNVSLDDLVYLTSEGDTLHRKSRLHAGDVVVVRTGQAGSAAVVPLALDGANCIDLVIIRPGPDYSSHFLEYVLNSDWMQKHIAEHSVGTIQSHFNVGAARMAPVPKAPKDAQANAVAKLEVERRRSAQTIDALRRQLDLLKERRQALITAAVTGQLDIPGAA